MMNEATGTRTSADSSAMVDLVARLGALELRLDEQATENARLKAENTELAETIARLKATPAMSPSKAAGNARQIGRRGLLAGAVALAAAGVTQALSTRAGQAAGGEGLIRGQTNTSASSTWATRDTPGDGAGTNCLIAIPADTNGNGFLGYSQGTGTGVFGAALGSGLGVQAGSNGGTALYAESLGTNYSYGVHAR